MFYVIKLRNNFVKVTMEKPDESVKYLTFDKLPIGPGRLRIDSNNLLYLENLDPPTPTGSSENIVALEAQIVELEQILDVLMEGLV